jgi:TolB-like protein
MIIKKYALILLCFIFVVIFSSFSCEAILTDQKASLASEAIKLDSPLFPPPQPSPPREKGIYRWELTESKIKIEGEKIKIGIIEFQSLNEEAKKDILGKVFSEVLTTSFVNSEAFKIIEREQLEKVLKELQLTQTGIIDTAYAKQIGKMVGADAILTGTVIKFGKDLRVDARIIDVESGIILTAEKGMGKADLKSISTMADSIVQNLVNKFYRNKK